ncbi:TetR/AcrR family transcriptional regulator [Subtercola boreus]|uniref:TetR family transcriptional regulator n=1 Tax=Subtercola boreus TaxID=120213 RepID=A0A3E0WG30_9MICO|nr:TetR/AcrR family transcriptional regulator [Subtercola boreus]RFA23393.1 TetR family transcriptional regulator [Subtercola boreus]RFA23786.1 TetR family transcriptional regulator [Subtercola boreus]RFA29487.1 TetR family transcriptional regulator [Subtercola boreus]
MDARLLPIAGPNPPERADAVRNRGLILEAARRILNDRGVDGLTMDLLAAEAGVGKGTIFRRFGSRSGLLLTLLNEFETDFQRRFMSGPAPLGPGALPIERLVAFGRERLALLEVQGDLLRAAEERPDLRYASAPRAAGAMHIHILLNQAGYDGDTAVLAFTLLSSLDATVVLYENRSANMSMQRLADGWEDVVRRVTAPRAS